MKKLLTLTILLTSFFCNAQQTNESSELSLSGTYQKVLRTDSGKRLFEMLIHETGIETKNEGHQLILIQIREFPDKKGIGNPDTTMIVGFYNKNQISSIKTFSGNGKYRNSLSLFKEEDNLFFAGVKYSEVKRSDQEVNANVEAMMDTFYAISFKKLNEEVLPHQRHLMRNFSIGKSRLAGDPKSLNLYIPSEEVVTGTSFFNKKSLQVYYSIYSKDKNFNHERYIKERYKNSLLWNEWDYGIYGHIPVFKYFPNLETIEILSENEEPLYRIDVKSMEISVVDRSKVKGIDYAREEKLEYEENLKKREIGISHVGSKGPYYKFGGNGIEFEKSLEGKTFILYSPSYTKYSGIWSILIFTDSNIEILDYYGSRTLPVQFDKYFPEFYHYDSYKYELSKFTIAKNEHETATALIDLTLSRARLIAHVEEIGEGEIEMYQKNLIEITSRLFEDKKDAVNNPSGKPFVMGGASAEYSFFDRMSIELYYGRFENVRKLESEMRLKPNSVLTALGQEYNFSSFFRAYHNIYLNAYSSRFSGEIKNSVSIKFSLTETETDGYGIVQSSNTTNYNIRMEPRFEAKYREYQDKIHTQGYSRYHINEARDLIGKFDFGDIRLRQLNENLYRYSIGLPPAKTLSEIQ